MNLISVIIPAYNVADFLPKCLDSILAQTYENWEAILIDDGSTDRSGEILDQYASQDARFVVIHQKNQGQAAAMNAGLDRMTGDFVTFVDGDDYVSPVYLQKLLGWLLENRADISKCFQVQFPEGGQVPAPYITEEVRVLDGSIDLLFQVQGIESFPMKLFRRQLFDGLRFPKFTVAMDSALMIRILEKNPKVVYNNSQYYYYLLRGTGATLAKSKHHLERIDAFASWLEVIEKNHPEDKFALHCAAIRFLEEGIGAVTRTCHLLTAQEVKGYKSRLRAEYRRLSGKTPLPLGVRCRFLLFYYWTGGYLMLKKARNRG